MSQYNKGTNTRNLLLKTAKSLFLNRDIMPQPPGRLQKKAM